MDTITTQANVTTFDIATQSKGVVIVLSDTDKLQVSKLAAQPLSVIEDKDVVMFGSDRQKAIGSQLDIILAEITKGSSPLLFELFVQLQKGSKDVKIDELEATIRESINTPWYAQLLQTIGLSSVASRAKAANEKINSMITSKSKSLLDLMKGMETKVQDEVNRLIQDSLRLKRLGIEFRQNIIQFGIYVEAGRQILAQAKTELARRQELASKSNDPLEAEEVKNFAQKVDLFEARLLKIETIYAKAPAELESLRLGQGASLSTLGETANSVLDEFNDIKSSLIQLSVSYAIQSVQQMNQQRRALRATLQKQSVKVLGDVAVNAAKAQGINAVEDAELLLNLATGIKDISNKVEEERKNNQQRFAEARDKLGQVRVLVSTINT